MEMEVQFQLLQKFKIMYNTSLKSKLKNNELTIGSWITIGHPAIPEILSQAGFDWLVVDIEHNSIDLSMIQTLIATIQSYGIAALVRVCKNEETIIKHVLDAGADGIIVPMVCSKQDAEMAIDYSKYPPRGKRGVGLSRAQQYGYNFESYKEWVEKDSVVIAQIEHIDAINNLEEIINVDGIDGTIIGPYDLSGSMGKSGHYDEDDVKEALKKYESICLENNVTLGFHVVDTNPDRIKDKINEKYSFLAYGTDFLFMGDNAKMGMDKICIRYL